MGAFDLATKTIQGDDWADGEEVVIRELNYGEQVDLETMSMESLTIGEASNKHVREQLKLGKFGLSKQQLAKMQKCIVSWTFTEGNGKQNRDMPVNETTLRALSSSYGSFIKEQIEELNPTRDEEFQAESGTGDEGQGEATTGDDAIRGST